MVAVQNFIHFLATPLKSKGNVEGKTVRPTCVLSDHGHVEDSKRASRGAQVGAILWEIFTTYFFVAVVYEPYYTPDRASRASVHVAPLPTPLVDIHVVIYFYNKLPNQ